jgi:hypothetical protein
MPSPDVPGATEINQRLQELMSEQLVQPEPNAETRLGRPSHRLGIGLAIGLALIVGLQLGALPWRFRREIWQVQGALVGLAAGVVIGRFSARRPD